MPEYPFKQTRLVHDDGSWSAYSSVEFPADKLSFRNIVLRDYETRLRDIAHLRSVKARQCGQDNPIIVAWACLEDFATVQDIFPELNAITDDCEHLVSANSLMSYTMRTLLARNWLFYDRDNWCLDIPNSLTNWQKRASAILGWLVETHRLWIEVPEGYAVSRRDFVNFDAHVNAIPVGNLNFLRREVQEQRHRVAFNAAYFLLEHDDFDSFHASLGEAYNLFIQDGHVIRPPLYRRSALYYGEQSKWQVSQIGMNDIAIRINEDIVLSADDDALFSYTVNPSQETAIAIYTRYYGVDGQGRALAYTPTIADRLELTIVGNTIVSWKMGGNLHIPQNGFVLSFAPDVLSHEQCDTILKNPLISYQMLGKFKDITHAIQSGPVLMRDSVILRDNDIFEQEEFWISRHIDDKFVLGVVPTDYPDDFDETRAGRLAIGIKADGNLIVVGVAGVNSGYNHNNTDSNGATLVEVAVYLQSQGAIHAVNLDGGGSTQLFYNYGAMVRFGDRRGSFGIIYERMIPSVGVVG